MPLVIAHRGASADAPENTLRAFELAQRQGAAMIELDVLSTADAELVVFHDETTERWDGLPRPVQNCSLAEMQALDIGGERVPTLAEALQFARESGMALNIELKRPGWLRPVPDSCASSGWSNRCWCLRFCRSRYRKSGQPIPLYAVVT